MRLNMVNVLRHTALPSLFHPQSKYIPTEKKMCPSKKVDFDGGERKAEMGLACKSRQRSDIG